MTAVVEIKGIDELQKALDELPVLIQPLAEKAMRKASLAVLGILKEYPPETDANKPGRMTKSGSPMPYYERNRGTWWPYTAKSPMSSMPMSFGKAKGAIRAKKAQQAQGVKAYLLDPTSEQLGKSWSVDVQTGNNGEVIGIIGTDVTYAEDVQGSNQEALFAQIGWKTIGDAADEAMPDIDAAFSDLLDQIRW